MTAYNITDNSMEKLLLILIIGFMGVRYSFAQNPEDKEYDCLSISIDWKKSDYVLPYPVGEEYFVNQANCSGYGHSNFWNHGYDFTMRIGTIITASRCGKVGWAKDGCNDGDERCTNLITIIHDDGTVALYSHLTKGGVLVKSGERIQVGDTIALSGNTGNTGGLPHLHFSIHPCNDLPGLPNAKECPSIPINFKNTEANPNGLIPKRYYKAIRY
jgi:murein DD-endopeptidase MepM/ murein hydrolase activator NlpD